MEASRARFDNYLTAIRMLITKIPQYFIPFWYGKEPMFWLPYGWFPYYAEWIISFPRAPMGSVSAPSWQLACSGVIALLGEILMFAGRQISAQPGEKAKKPGKQTAEKSEEKKEL